MTMATPVAWTRIAAMLLLGGHTVHSRFKLSLILTNTLFSSLKVNSKESSTIRKSELMIWDDVPVTSAYALIVVNRLLKDIMENDVFFGRKVIVLGRDFRKMLPVNPHGSG
jgi:hypothetical protein